MSTILPQATRRRAFRRIGTVLRAYWLRLTLALVLGLVTATAGLAGPWAVGRLVDELSTAPVLEPVLIYTGIVAAAGVVAAVGTWLGAVNLSRALEPAIAQLREETLSAGLALDSRTVERAGRGDLVSRIADDSREVSTAATTVMPLVVQSLFTVVVAAVGMAALDWRLGITGLVAIPLYWSTLHAYLPRSGPLYRQEREAFGVRTQRLLGGIGGATTLRAYGAEETELHRIDTASARARDISITVFRFLTWAFSRNNRAEAIVLVLLLSVGFLLVSADAVTVGAVSTAALIFHRLFGPIGVLVGMFDQVQSAGASLVRMVGLIETAETDLPIGESSPSAGVGICLRGVKHSYDGQRTVVSGVDLGIQPGEHVAVVGATGAGKSTVAQMVAGLLIPDRGVVLIGGVPVEEVAPAQLRSAVAMVSQEVHNFRGSVLDNVRIANPAADDSQVHAALAAVGADRWVARLADAGQTLIGDGGYRLSPVQDQMLALARLHLADPEFVVLDEATAEAGSGGAGALDAAAAAVLAGRGALIVAHRLSQAAAADRVIVMDHGRIIESGTHVELSTGSGPYSRLWDAWRGEGPVGG